jgi:hypothetical protein
MVAAILVLVAINFVMSWKRHKDIMEVVDDVYWQIDDLEDLLFEEEETPDCPLVKED